MERFYYVCDFRTCHSRFQPRFRLSCDEHSSGSVKSHPAAAIIHQNLRELSIAQRSISFGNVRRRVGGRRPDQS